jgi:hypothetical protein
MNWRGRDALVAVAVPQQAIDGDREALEGLVRALQADVYGLSLRMPWNREDAEDATQAIPCPRVSCCTRWAALADAAGRGGRQAGAAPAKPQEPVRYKVVDSYFGGHRRLTGSGTGDAAKIGAGLFTKPREVDRVP